MQFGFRKFHSTASALLDCTNSWYMNMDRKMFNLILFLDLKKAFDTVNHDILVRMIGVIRYHRKCVVYDQILFNRP